MNLPHLDWKEISAFVTAASKLWSWCSYPWRATRHLLLRWKARPSRKALLERNAFLEDHYALAERERQMQLLNPQPQVNVPVHQPEVARLPDLQERLLVAAANGDIFRDTLHRIASIHLIASRFHLQELFDRRFIDYRDSTVGSYKITHEGARYLLTHGLMPPVKPPALVRTAGSLAPRAATQADLKRRRINPAPGSWGTRG